MALRNAPTELMKSMGYGKGYAYAHDDKAGAAAMEYLPDALQGRRYYVPSTNGHERVLVDNLKGFLDPRGTTNNPSKP